jgi:hypothetical protein
MPAPMSIMASPDCKPKAVRISRGGRRFKRAGSSSLCICAGSNLCGTLSLLLCKIVSYREDAPAAGILHRCRPII